MQIQITIGLTGDIEWFALNTREDLLLDYEYFVALAKETPVDDREKVLLHKRFLRAALLILFAYAEAVVNAWLYEVLAKRNLPWLFKSIERARLDDKMELLCEAASTSTASPNVTEAKQVRNLLVHFKPTNEGAAFERLSLELVERTFTEFEKWITEMEKLLNTARHHDSKKEAQEFMGAMADQGVAVKPNPFKP